MKKIPAPRPYAVSLSPMSSLMVSFANPTLFRSRNAMKYNRTITGTTRRLTLRKVRSPSSPRDAPGVAGCATATSVRMSAEPRGVSAESLRTVAGPAAVRNRTRYREPTVPKWHSGAAEFVHAPPRRRVHMNQAPTAQGRQRDGPKLDRPNAGGSKDPKPERGNSEQDVEQEGVPRPDDPHPLTRQLRPGPPSGDSQSRATRVASCSRSGPASRMQRPGSGSMSVSA